MAEATINILTRTVRDPQVTSNSFALILFLKLKIFERKGYSFFVASDDMKRYTGLSDKQLNASLKELFLLNYITKEIGKRIPNKPVHIELNRIKFDTDKRKDGEYFTRLPIKILYLLKEGIINTKEVRFLYYVQSFINNNKTNRLYCFSGIDTRMINELDMSKPTIIKVHRSLTEKKLIMVKQHNTSWHYDEDGNLLHTRYNNHYYIIWENIDKSLQKQLSKESAIS